MFTAIRGLTTTFPFGVNNHLSYSYAAQIVASKLLFIRLPKNNKKTFLYILHVVGS